MNSFTSQLFRTFLLLPILISALIACGSGSDTPAAVPVPDPQPVVVASYNFEESTDGWTIDGL